MRGFRLSSLGDLVQHSVSERAYMRRGLGLPTALFTCAGRCDGDKGPIDGRPESISVWNSTQRGRLAWSGMEIGRASNFSGGPSDDVCVPFNLSAGQCIVHRCRSDISRQPARGRSAREYESGLARCRIGRGLNRPAWIWTRRCWRRLGNMPSPVRDPATSPDTDGWSWPGVTPPSATT